MKIVITHGYSDDNKGDLAIVTGLVTLIRSHFYGQEPQITLLSVYPRGDPNFQRHHRHASNLGLKVIPGFLASPYSSDTTRTRLDDVRALVNLLQSALRVIAFICSRGRLGQYLGADGRAMTEAAEADLVFCKGGQYLYSDQGGLRGLLYLSRVSSIVRVCAALGHRPILFGHSLGPVKDRKSRSILRWALQYASFVGVREEMSLNLAKGLGVPAHLVSDTAFAIPRSHQSSELVQNADRRLGVTVVNWTFPGCSASVKALLRVRYLESIVAMVEHAWKHYGLKPLLIPQVDVRHDGESDGDLLDEILGRLQERSVPTERRRNDDTPEQLMEQYALCFLLIATRLHSAILAAQASIPSVIISYQGFKSWGIAREVGLEDYVVDITELDTERCIAILDHAIRQRNQLGATIAGKVASIRILMAEDFDRAVAAAT